MTGFSSSFSDRKSRVGGLCPYHWRACMAHSAGPVARGKSACCMTFFLMNALSVITSFFFWLKLVLLRLFFWLKLVLLLSFFFLLKLVLLGRSRLRLHYVTGSHNWDLSFDTGRGKRHQVVGLTCYGPVRFCQSNMV